MAERDELAGLLGGHDAGNAGDGERIALLEAIGEDGGNRLWLAEKTRLGDGAPTRHRLVTDIDDVGLAAGVEMGEAALGHQRTVSAHPSAARGWRRPRRPGA